MEQTTGFSLSRGLSWCRCARPHHRYLHNSCCISGGDFLALICRGARTCVSVFYPHGQSVMCRCIINTMGVQSFELNKLMLWRLQRLYAGLHYNIGSVHPSCTAYLSGGCSPHPVNHSTGSVHLLCTAYLAGGVVVRTPPPLSA